jgi:hypothetical protein
MQKTVVVPVVLALLVAAGGLSGCSSSTSSSAGDEARAEGEAVAKVAEPLLAEMRAAEASAAGLRAPDTPRLSALVFLNETANLQAAAFAPSREAKAAIVYEAVRDTATASQRDLVAFLTREGIRHRAFHITNMVSVHDVSAATLRRFAARADVKRIAPNRPRRMTLPALPPMTEPSSSPSSRLIDSSCWRRKYSRCCFWAPLSTSSRMRRRTNRAPERRPE